VRCADANVFVCRTLEVGHRTISAGFRVSTHRRAVRCVWSQSESSSASVARVLAGLCVDDFEAVERRISSRFVRRRCMARDYEYIVLLGLRSKELSGVPAVEWRSAVERSLEDSDFIAPCWLGC
jgi:hypothetical protein